MITCDKIIEERKTVQTNFNKTKVICKTRKLYILLAFKSFTIVLLITVTFTVTWQNINQNKNIYYQFTSQIKNLKKFYISQCITKMESNYKLKEVDIKNGTCYCFDNIIKFGDLDLDNILIDEKSCENILVYNISCKMFNWF